MMTPTHLVYFDCGHAALNSQKHPVAVLQLPPKLEIERINAALTPELRGKVAIACYPANLCARCEPDQSKRVQNIVAMVKAQLQRDLLPIPPDAELEAEIRKQLPQ